MYLFFSLSLLIVTKTQKINLTICIIFDIVYLLFKFINMKNAFAGLFLATSLVAQPGFAENQQNTTKDAVMMCFREST